MSSSFVVGLCVGVAIGAGGVYAALEKPWASASNQAKASTSDAGPDQSADEGKDKGKGKRGRRGKRAGRGRGDSSDEVELQEIDERVVLSAADRKLIWRGPDIAIPNSSVDFGAGQGGRPLDDGEINAGVSSGQSSMVSCIAEARGQAELAAKITLKILVSERGSVTKVRMQAPSYLFANGLYECAGRAARQMRFASTGAPTVVTVPFDLSF